MNLFSVDQEKCNRCGICAAECPARVIKYKDKDSYPIPFTGASERCIKCGHCVAVCPHGAFKHKDMKPEDCLPLEKGMLLSQKQVELFLRSRRSIRVYQDKSVEREVLQKLIEIARYAPTAKNLQHVQWIVIYDKDKVNQLGDLVIDWMRYMIQENPETSRALKYDLVVEDWERGVDRIFRGAPHLVITHSPAKDPYASEDCVGALTYLELAAYAMGLGSCWAGYFTTAAGLYQPIKELLVLPQGHSCFGAVMVGYPKYRYQRIPLRDKPVIEWR